MRCCGLRLLAFEKHSSTGWRRSSKAQPFSTCSREAARWVSRRCRGAQSALYSSSDPSRQSGSWGTTSPRWAATTHRWSRAMPLTTCATIRPSHSTSCFSIRRMRPISTKNCVDCSMSKDGLQAVHASTWSKPKTHPILRCPLAGRCSGTRHRAKCATCCCRRPRKNSKGSTEDRIRNVSRNFRSDHPGP